MLFADQSHLTAGERIFNISQRMLSLFYVGFFFFLILSAGAVFAVSMLEGGTPFAGDATGELAATRNVPFGWDQWRYALFGIAIACIYASRRITAHMLSRDRLWRGTHSLMELGAELKKQNPRFGGSKTRTHGAGLDAEQVGASYATQYLIVRLLTGHLFAWILAEIPLILGVMDRFLVGRSEVFYGMVLAAALIMVLNRPHPDRLRELLAPVLHGQLGRTA